jgi:uncharacterized protein YcbX
MILSQETFDDVNKKLKEKGIDGLVVSARNFRPNIILKGLQSPYDEDQWLRFSVDETVIECVKPCTRCTLPNVNPDSGIAVSRVSEIIVAAWM